MTGDRHAACGQIRIGTGRPVAVGHPNGGVMVSVRHVRAMAMMYAATESERCDGDDKHDHENEKSTHADNVGMGSAKVKQTVSRKSLAPARHRTSDFDRAPDNDRRSCLS
jgi:hypothetical protein